MAVDNFIALVDVPDYRYDKNCVSIDYGKLADDCDTKTICLMSAIRELSLNIFCISEDKKIDDERLRSLSGAIMELTDLAISTNKVAQMASYLSGVKGKESGKCHSS